MRAASSMRPMRKASVTAKKTLRHRRCRRRSPPPRPRCRAPAGPMSSRAMRRARASRHAGRDEALADAPRCAPADCAGTMPASFGSSAARAACSSAMRSPSGSSERSFFRYQALALVDQSRTGLVEVDLQLAVDPGCRARRSRQRATAARSRRAPWRRRAPTSGRRAAGGILQAVDEGRPAAIDQVVGEDARDDLAPQPVPADLVAHRGLPILAGK